MYFKYVLKMFRLKFYYRCFVTLSVTTVFPHDELYCFLRYLHLFIVTEE